MTKVSELLTAKEEDLQYGQHVIVAARWILVLTGLMLAIWNPAELAQLRFQFLFLLLLAAANFYLHAMLLMGKSFDSLVVYGASAADLVVITIMVLLGDGFESNTFVFYYPAILVFSVAFPGLMTAMFTTGAIGIYGLIGLATIDFAASDTQTLVSRIIMMAAVAVIGNQYLRMERNRREAASQARQNLMAEVRSAQSREPAAPPAAT